jgi:hypothetical protein
MRQKHIAERYLSLVAPLVESVVYPVVLATDLAGGDFTTLSMKISPLLPHGSIGDGTVLTLLCPRTNSKEEVVLDLQHVLQMPEVGTFSAKISDQSTKE